MLLTAKQRGFRPECVLFDSWYASVDNLRLVRDCGWRWLTQLKGNRKVNVDRHGVSSDSGMCDRRDGNVVWLKEYGLIRVFRVVAPNGETEYWATNDLEMKKGID